MSYTVKKKMFADFVFCNTKVLLWLKINNKTMKEKKEKKLRRSPSSFRLRDEVTEIIRLASEQTGMSGAEIVDACVLANVDDVVCDEVARQRAIKSPTAVTALVKALVKREYAETELYLEKAVSEDDLEALRRNLDPGLQPTPKAALPSGRIDALADAALADSVSQLRAPVAAPKSPSKKKSSQTASK